MRTEGIGHLKISKDPIGNRTRNLPSCGALPQPTETQISSECSLEMNIAWVGIVNANQGVNQQRSRISAINNPYFEPHTGLSKKMDGI